MCLHDLPFCVKVLIGSSIVKKSLFHCIKSDKLLQRTFKSSHRFWLISTVIKYRQWMNYWKSNLWHVGLSFKNFKYATALSCVIVCGCVCSEFTQSPNKYCGLGRAMWLVICTGNERPHAPTKEKEEKYKFGRNTASLFSLPKILWKRSNSSFLSLVAVNGGLTRSYYIIVMQGCSTQV